jgi:acyl-CoA thioesterase I
LEAATLPDAPRNGKVAQPHHRKDNMNFRKRCRPVGTFRAGLCLAAAAFIAAGFGFTATAHAQIVAFGASNVAGRGVGSSEAFPARLERMLAAKGCNIHVANAGISGDTNAGMLARLDQGDQKPEYAAIVARLRSRCIKIIPVTANGVGRGELQSDGIHLTAEGHALLAARLLPSVVRALGH